MSIQFRSFCFLTFIGNVGFAAAASAGTVCQYPSTLTGTDSTFLHAGSNTQVPRFDVNLTNQHSSHSVLNTTTTLAFQATRQQGGGVDPLYIPTSVTDLIDPDGIFRSDFSMNGDQGEYTTINGVNKLSVRTEPWFQPMAFNLSGSAPKNIYIDLDPTQETSLAQQARYGWCDLLLANIDSAVDRQQVTLGVLSPYQQTLVDLGIQYDPNQTKSYTNLAYLELVEVDLGFDQGLSIFAANPSNLNHSQSLDMNGGVVGVSTTGDDVIFKLIDSSINFADAGNVSTVPDAARPSHLILWIAKNPNDPSANTSQLSFDTNESVLPVGAETKVFVDAQAKLIVRDTGNTSDAFIFPNYAQSVAGWVDTSWDFAVGEDATLVFENSNVNFGEHKDGGGGLNASSSIGLSQLATLELTGNGTSVVIDELNYIGTPGGGGQVDLTANDTYLEATSVSVTDGEMTISSSQGLGDYYFKSVFLNDGALTLENGKRSVGMGRPWDIINLYSEAGSNELNFTNWGDTIRIEGLSIKSDLDVNMQGNNQPAEGNVVFLGAVVVSDSVATPQFNLSDKIVVDVFGKTLEVNTHGHVQGSAKVDMNLAQGSAVRFFGDQKDTVTIVTNETALKSYDPSSVDPINLGPTSYNLTALAGAAPNQIYLSNEIFLNDEFGNNLADNTEVTAEVFSLLMVGDSCSPNLLDNCDWNRTIGRVKLPRYVMNTDSTMFFDISLDADGNAINDQIETGSFFAPTMLNFVVNSLPQTGSNQALTATDLDGKTFTLLSSSETPTNSTIRGRKHALVEGDTLPATTRLFWYEEAADTKQFVIGAETDLIQLHRKSTTRNQRGLADLVTITSGSKTDLTAAPITDQHKAVKLQSGKTLATALNTLSVSQWNQFSQYHAEPFASYMTVGLDQNLMIGDTVMSHAIGAGEFIDNVVSGVSSSTNEMGINANRTKSRDHVWSDIQFSDGTVKEQNDLAGFAYQLGAVEIGTDLWETGSSTMGAFAGLGFTQMNSADLTSTSFSSQGVNAGLYGRHRLGGNFNLTGMFGLDYNLIESKRNVATVGSFQGGTAKSNYNSWGAFAGARIDRPIKLESSNSYITPFAELTYAGQNFSAISENDAGDLGYDLDATSAHALVGGVGFDVSHGWDNEGIEYGIDAFFRYEHDFLANSSAEHSVHVQSQLTGHETSLFGIGRGSEGLSAGIGFAAQISPDITVSAAFRHTNWSHGTQNQIGANFTMLW